MSLLAQQVASLTKAYRPPVPRRGTGRLHVIADDPDPVISPKDGPFVCRTCKQTKQKEDYYYNVNRQKRETACKECVKEAKKLRYQQGKTA